MRYFKLRIHLLSDLHLEFSQYTPSPAVYAADLIVLAGDIFKKDHGVHMARAMFPNQTIVMVMGNHEHYGQDIIANTAKIRATAKELGVHLLENDELIFKGVRILGCTLWTDFNLYGKREECMQIAQNRLNDFHKIRIGDRAFTPQDSLDIHNESVAWLKSKLDEPFAGPTVVVTHHSPCFNSVAPRFQSDLLSACFSSQLYELLDWTKVRLWLHGHTHDSFNYHDFGVNVIANPRGYNSTGIDGHQENKQFNKDLIIEINADGISNLHYETFKLKEPKVRKISSKQRDEAIIAIDQLEWKQFGDIGLKYVDLGILKPKVRTLMKQLMLANGMLLESIPENEAVLPVATFNIEWLIEQLIERSDLTMWEPPRMQKLT